MTTIRATIAHLHVWSLRRMSQLVLCAAVIAAVLFSAQSSLAESYSKPTHVICQTAGMYENATGQSRMIRLYTYGEPIGYRRYATEHPGWDVVENWAGSTANSTRWGFMLHYCVAH